MTDHPPDQPNLLRALPAAPGALPQGLWGESKAAQSSADEQSVDLRRYLAALARHKWMIVALTIVGTVAGFAAVRFVPPVYAAQSTLWLQVGGNVGGRQTGPIQASELLQQSSWVDLLRSFVVLDEVVRREHVYIERTDAADSTLFSGFRLKPSFVSGQYRLEISRDGRNFVLTLTGQEVQRAAVGDSIGSASGFEWLPNASELRPGRVIRFGVRTPRDAALALREKLQTTLPQQGSFLRLVLEGRDPSATAATLNAVAERFVEVAAELKRQKLTELSAILREQLSSSYIDLGRAERSLEGFRVHTITLPSEQASPVTPGLEQTRDPVFRAFFEMRVERERLDRDQQSIARVLARPDSGISPVQLEAIASVRESAELSRALGDVTTREAEARAMRLQFTEQHPPLQRLDAEIAELRRQTIPALARQLAAQLAARVRDTDTRIGSASRELQQIPTRAIEEARLRRDVAIAENLYTTLQQRYEEARLAEVSSIPDVRILDRAVAPDRPLKDRAILFLLGGLFGGLGGAVGLAILLDQFDRRVRYPEEVSLGMGLSILGALPRLRNGGRRADSEAEAQVVEALRTIRLNLVNAYGSAGPLVITITSPGSGDGKSFLASNLAVSFADAGHRILLIDADIRRGSLHRVLGAERKPGLLDFLGGRATREEVVQTTKIKGVEFIGSGTRKNAGPELLASSAMSQFLISLRGTYGVIIIDSAPLGAGVDPLILGSLTGNLVLVLRTGVTDREFTMAKLEAVSRLPIRVLGVVLNDVKSEGQYAYYSYLPGYATSEENEDADVGPKRLQRGG
jgi:tyrosine-protein kinase Etk/Wzc